MHIEMHYCFVKGDPPVSKLVYSIRSFDLQNVYSAHLFKEWIHRSFKHLFEQIKSKAIDYFINFAKKAQSDTLSIKDCIFPFFLGCVVFQLMFMFLNI